jgi:hypothetical protein
MPYGINIVQTRNKNGAPAGGTGEKERKGFFIINADARGQPVVRLEIPGIAPAVLESDAETINQDNSLVHDLLQAIIRGMGSDEATPLVAGITGCVSSRGYTLVSSGTGTEAYAKKAYKYHRKSSKGSRSRRG